MSAFAAPQPSPEVYNRIARIAAATAKSDVAFVTLRINRKLTVIGTYGMYVRPQDGNWDAVQKLVRVANITFVANVKRDANFKNHPLLTAAPFSKNLLHVPVQGHDADVEASISLVNIGMKWPLTATVTGILTELAMLVGDALKMDGTVTDRSRDPKAQEIEGFCETRTTTSEEPAVDTSGRFLLSTLSHKTSIRHRNDVAYITLRRWSKPIKNYQLKALTICKADPDSKFVDAIANEVATHVRQIFGGPRFGCVMPVPCGHSKTTDCMAVQIAKRVARILDVPFVDGLEGSNRPGSSHPRKNARLCPPKLKTAQKYDSVLLLDDVASSGRHIELSVLSLQDIAKHITAIAWIGPN